MKRYYLTLICFIVIILVVGCCDIFSHISSWYYIISFSTFIFILIFGSSRIDSQFFVSAQCFGDANMAQIALTFDDGPVPGRTDRILDLLKSQNIKAAFFCIGKNVKAHPELAKRIVDEGHLIGNHSYFHRHLFSVQNAKAIEKEIHKTDEIIMTTTGYEPRFFRPPYGVTNPMLAKAIGQTKHNVMGWSLRSFDTTGYNAEKLMNAILFKLKAGDILLFHDRCESMFVMLPKLLEEIKRLGLKVERPDHFFKQSPK